jgi:pimeloyl-ACP methyl ester carboxylesterase
MASDVEAMRSVRLPDGRSLEYVEFGAASGPLVVFHHGSPGSAFTSPSLRDGAAARGLRVVSASRAGYGGSTRDEGRPVAAVAADTTAILDDLGVDRFATIGWSGGGPHALACAALLPGRCVAALSVAGVAPYRPGEFDWTEGMGQENVEEFALALEAGPAYDEMLAGFREVLLALDPGDVRSARDLFGTLVSDVDEAAATPAFVALLLGNGAHGLREGVGGWRDDDQAFLHDWGVDLATMTTPVAVWFGDHDLMVPARHGDWLAAHVHGARERRFADEGHLSIVVQRSGEMLDELVAMAGGAW